MDDGWDAAFSNKWWRSTSQQLNNIA